MPSSISQRMRVKASITPQDITTARTGAYVDVSGAQRVLGFINAGTVAQTKKITAKFIQAKDAAGTGAKDLGTAQDTIAPTGGAALSPTIEAKIEDLDSANGYKFVALYALSDNATAVNAGGTIILSGNRFNP
jgi:hypothetical protein